LLKRILKKQKRNQKKEGEEEIVKEDLFKNAF
jgi:hypothetical protein